MAEQLNRLELRPELEALRLNDPVVYAGMRVFQFGYMTYAEAMEEIVILLAAQKAELTKIVLHNAMEMKPTTVRASELEPKR